MSRIFKQVQAKKVGTNLFDLSHEVKLSCNHGDLIPILLQETVPGDKFTVNQEIFARLAPMLAPVMHRMDVYTHYFFVPNRLTWSNWEKFITGGEDGLQTATFPKINMTQALTTSGYFNAGSLWDYMGYPTANASAGVVTQGFNALPFRAYAHIYNEFYRDQTLNPKLVYGISDSVTENTTLLTMRKRSWEKDYFTSALPWAQRGGEVVLPMEADINYLPTSIVKTTAGAFASDASVIGTPSTGGTGTGQMWVSKQAYNSGGGSGRIENLESIENATTTINDLRKAVRLQEWLEKNARAGSRYIEQIFSHFGVKSSDARLQRPEYLGGSRQPISISEVLSTYQNQESTTDSPVGTMSGHGVSVGGDHGFSKRFEEHGLILGIMSILPRTAYGQGMPRLAKKFDKFDYYWPEFAQIGEQEIFQGEIFHDCTQAEGTNLATFGYTPRYSEYKFANSRIHGDFKSTLEYWHMGRKFDTSPSLNAAFVAADPTYRIFANTTAGDHHYYIQMYNKVKAIRPMPIFGTPTL